MKNHLKKLQKKYSKLEDKINLLDAKKDEISDIISNIIDELRKSKIVKFLIQQTWDISVNQYSALLETFIEKKVYDKIKWISSNHCYFKIEDDLFEFSNSDGHITIVPLKDKSVLYLIKKYKLKVEKNDIKLKIKELQNSIKNNNKLIAYYKNPIKE